jgi:hypothetical protein
MKKLILLPILAPLTLGMVGCATTGHDDAGPFAPIKPLAIWAGFATEPQKAADFVEKSRTEGSLDYQPVGVTPAGPAKKVKKMSPAELKTLEDELETTRQKNDEAAGKSPE